ncbi:MAG TPA: FAD-dependent monooxygenase [Pyrinomonadaceae bacterium]|nr:FAD-dependent monooxygenase [Pyrinomonadaceae bacterium]
MTVLSNEFDVAIAGGGPAGSSAAIQLALNGARVLLVEQKEFPRPKLCGEFISPECISHFERLGVAGAMLAAGASQISNTVFYSRSGASVYLPSEWFKPGARALGLSRGEMDHKLLERAKEVGVTVLENAHAGPLLHDGTRVSGFTVRVDDTLHACRAIITIDATGRNRALARPLSHSAIKPKLVAFKVHLKNAYLNGGDCEIYFYQRGYGGLSRIENGTSNLCFIVAARDVRRLGSDPETVMREVVMQNKRAAFTLRDAHPCSAWLSVSLTGFERYSVTPEPGLLAVGDAAAFIDPFTGSGMLMALESGQLAADTINRHSRDITRVAADYRVAYAKTFHPRMRVASLLRRAAFIPGFADAAIRLTGISSRVRREIARATHRSIAPSVDAGQVR